MNDPQNVEDVVSINLRFANGSIGNIMYISNGAKNVAKEYIEVHRSGATAILDDYRKLTVYGKGKPFHKKLVVQDKGQSNMIDAFTSSIKNGEPGVISFHEIYAVTMATIKAVESLRTSQAYSI